MAASENTPSENSIVPGDYDVLERDLRMGIALAEAKVQRLMGDIFVYPLLAEQAFRKLSQRRGFEHAVTLLEQTVFQREMTFGVFRTGLFGMRKRAVAAALQELPAGLRDLNHLNDRLEDVCQARRSYLSRMQSPAPDAGDDVIMRRKRGRGR